MDKKQRFDYLTRCCHTLAYGYDDEARAYLISRGVTIQRSFKALGFDDEATADLVSRCLATVESCEPLLVGELLRLDNEADLKALRRASPDRQLLGALSIVECYKDEEEGAPVSDDELLSNRGALAIASHDVFSLKYMSLGTSFLNNGHAHTLLVLFNRFC